MIIHSIWLGSNVPDRVYENMNTWRNTNCNYEIRLYTHIPSNVLELCPMAKNAMDNKEYAFVADWYRIYLLKNYGGVYLDTDMVLYKSLADLNLGKIFLSCYENEYNISAGFLYSPPNGAVISELFNYYTKLNSKCRDTIPHHLDKVINRIREGSFILPQVNFYHYSYDDYKNGLKVTDKISSKSYGNHLWDESWKN